MHASPPSCEATRDSNRSRTGSASAFSSGGPGGERWEIYTVLADSPTFWGQDSEQRWDADQAELDGVPAGQATQCCGGPQTDSAEENASSGVC
jgi:hypothetical protein